MLDPDTRIYAAHMADNSATISAPSLEMADLRALEATLLGIGTGTLKPAGWYPRRYPVRGMITFGTGYSWNNR